MKKTLITLFTILLIVSCGKDNPLEQSEFAEESFVTWLSKNDPDAVPFVDNGGTVNRNIFLRFVERGPEPVDSQKLVDYAWFYSNYTGYTLDGTIFVTRDSLKSRLIGKWQNSTHWVDDFLQVYQGNSSFSPGLYKVIQTLRPGDSLRIYLQGSEAFQTYGMNINSGYRGETTNYVDFPLYFDIRIGKVVHTPLWAEQVTVNDYAAREWNLSINDTVKKGLYMNILKFRPDNDSIGRDSIIEFHYTQRFMDGFFITSTSDSIAKAENRYNPASAENTSGETYGVKRLAPNENNGLPRALYECLVKMRKGETAEIISVSTWTTQGNTGSFSYTPQIMPFQPIKYLVEIADSVGTDPI